MTGEQGERDRMVWPAAALVAAQVIHGLVPVDKHHVNSEGFVWCAIAGRGELGRTAHAERAARVG